MISDDWKSYIYRNMMLKHHSGSAFIIAVFAIPSES